MSIYDDLSDAELNALAKDIEADAWLSSMEAHDKCQ